MGLKRLSNLIQYIENILKIKTRKGPVKDQLKTGIIGDI